MAEYGTADFFRISETDECRVFALDYPNSGGGTPPQVPGQFNELAVEIGIGGTAICLTGGASGQFGMVFFLESNGVDTVTATKMGGA